MRFDETFRGDLLAFQRATARFIETHDGFAWDGERCLSFFFGRIKTGTKQLPFRPLDQPDWRTWWLDNAGFCAFNRTLADGRICLTVQAPDEAWPDLAQFWQQWRMAMIADGWLNSAPKPMPPSVQPVASESEPAVAEARKAIKPETRRRAELAVGEKEKNFSLSYQGAATRLSKRREEARQRREDLGIGDKEPITGDDINYAVGEMRKLEPGNPKWIWDRGDPTHRR